MKVLFLDIDGVLNRDCTKETVDTIFGPFKGIDRYLLGKLLNWKGNHPDVSIVLSSSWRLDDRYDKAFTKHLRELGIDWISETPNTGRRGNDIHSWLLQHPEVTHHAILDDDADMYPVGKFHIQTSPIHGVRDKHFKKLNYYLNETSPSN
jgi:hypothetical protein